MFDKASVDYVIALQKAGDQLQSSASRMAEFLNEQGYDYEDRLTGDSVPYEVRMAALEARRAVEAWTEARR